MSKTLTDRESDIMQVLWDRGACRVSDVRRHLKDPLAHNTVLTMLGILEEKGFGLTRYHYYREGHIAALRATYTAVGAHVLTTRVVSYSATADEMVVRVSWL